MAESPSRITKTTLIDEALAKFGGKPFNKAMATELMSWIPQRIGYYLSKGHEFNWIGLGTWKRKVRAAGTYRNPSTGATLRVPQQRVARFSPSIPLKMSIAFPAQAKKLAEERETHKRKQRDERAMSAKAKPEIKAAIKPGPKPKANPEIKATPNPAKRTVQAAAPMPPMPEKRGRGRPPSKPAEIQMPPPKKTAGKETRLSAKAG